MGNGISTVNLILIYSANHTWNIAYMVIIYFFNNKKTIG